jgi:hypothetical protein
VVAERAVGRPIPVSVWIDQFFWCSTLDDSEKTILDCVVITDALELSPESLGQLLVVVQFESPRSKARTIAAP